MIDVKMLLDISNQIREINKRLDKLESHRHNWVSQDETGNLILKFIGYDKSIKVETSEPIMQPKQPKCETNYKSLLKKADKMREIARDKVLHKDDDDYNNIINNIETNAKEGLRSVSILLLEAQPFYKDENSFKSYKTYLGSRITEKVIDKLKDEGFIITLEPVVFSFQIDKISLPIREKEVKNARIIISW